MKDIETKTKAKWSMGWVKSSEIIIFKVRKVKGWL